MKHLARDLSETRYSTDGDCYNDVTWWTDSSGLSVGYLSVTNSEGPGYAFYVVVSPAGADDFNHKMAHSVGYTGVPIVIAAKTTNLTGWNRTIDHFVNIWAYNIDSNWVQWSDSAGRDQSGSTESLGFHTRSLTSFYSENVAPGNGFAW